MNIEEKLLSLERGENLQNRKNYCAEIRNYQDYLVPFLVGKNDSQEIFKMCGLYGFESIPIFLSEKIYSSFQNDYLKKHGYSETIEQKQTALIVKTMTGTELFEILSASSSKNFFVLASDENELLFNFNLVEVFTDCFYETQSEFEFELLSKLTETAKFEIQENFCSTDDLVKSVYKEIELGKKFRKLFKIDEWFVLISQPTKNKLLKGEFSRDNFALDRHGDKQIFIFSDVQALDVYKNAIAQSGAKLYSIKVDCERIFGSDLSEYETVFINPTPQNVTKIGKEHFKKLSELFVAFQMETKLFHLKSYKKEVEDYSWHYYIDVKKFQNFILPLDTKPSKDSNLDFPDLPVYLIRNESGKTIFPVFTAKDSFEEFRLHYLEKTDSENINFIEPYFIDGLKLAQIIRSFELDEIVFNHNSSVESMIFESNFALKVFCA